MKFGRIAALILVSLLVAPLSAECGELNNLVGTYESSDKELLSVKRLTFTREKNGSTKLTGALVGFPEEVSLGEGTPEVYVGKNGSPDEMISSFNTKQTQGLLLIRFASGFHKAGTISCTCYTKDGDGRRTHRTTILNQERQAGK